MSIDPEQLANFLENGWGGMSQASEPPAPSDEQMDEQYEIDKMLHAAFSSGPGAEALEHLRSMTIEQPAFNPQTGLVGILQGFSREGQDSIVRYIESRMRRAQQGPPSKQKK